MSTHSEEPKAGAGTPGTAETVDYMTDTRPIAVGETAPGCKKRDPILVAEDVTRSFGGINAVDVQYLEIPRHKITALIGPNGAGKTTLFNLLTGFDTPNSGTWQFEGNNIAGVSSYKVARMGMVRTFQLTKVMGKLTVMENMRLGASSQSGERLSKALFKGIWGGQEKKITQEANVLLEKFKLDAKRDDYAASLSGGQRKLLEMARSLMVRPKVVMAEGKIVAEGPPAEVMKNPAVIDAYLGAHHDVDLGDAEGIKELAAELVADDESIVGTENAGIISAEVLETEAAEAEARGTAHGRRSAEEPP